MAGSGARPPPRMSIESGPYTFHYLIDGDVAYLTLAEKVKQGRESWRNMQAAAVISMPRAESAAWLLLL